MMQTKKGEAMTFRYIHSLFMSILASIIIASALTGCSPKPVGETEETEPEPAPVEQETTAIDVPRAFVDAYNSKASTPLTMVGTFDVQNEDSGHYRVEFRLGAYSEAQGMYCTAGDMQVDIIFYGNNSGMSDNDTIRVYADGPRDDVAAFYRTAAEVLDPGINQSELNEAISTYLDGYNGILPNSTIRSSILNQTSATDWEAMLDSQAYVESLV